MWEWFSRWLGAESSQSDSDQESRGSGVPEGDTPAWLQPLAGRQTGIEESGGGSAKTHPQREPVGAAEGKSHRQPSQSLTSRLLGRFRRPVSATMRKSAQTGPGARGRGGPSARLAPPFSVQQRAGIAPLGYGPGREQRRGQPMGSRMGPAMGQPLMRTLPSVRPGQMPMWARPSRQPGYGPYDTGRTPASQSQNRFGMMQQRRLMAIRSQQGPTDATRRAASRLSPSSGGPKRGPF